MREIKFKFYDKHDKTLISLGDVFSLYNGLDRLNLIPCQFTGLKDKNGKEIYEGDIVTIHEGTPIKIVWGYSGWECITKENEIATSFSGFHDEMEIIGNIYENPNLLT